MTLPVRFSKILGSALAKTNCLHNVVRRCSNIWEPDYLILGKTKTPEYDQINVQIKGYDFAVLENYQSLIHRIAGIMDVDVETCWAFPLKDLKVQKFFSNSSLVEYQYNLKLYERNIQIVDAKSHIMPLFLEAVITACPPGVNVNVHEHTEEIEEDRYVPDYEVLDLQKSLDDIGVVKKKKK